MLVETFIFAVILISLCLVGLGIGLLITGKTKLRKGCGLPPEFQKKGKCKTGSCNVCSSSRDSEKTSKKKS